WLILLPVALILVALQTGAEEIAFRGYLQSALAARFASPVIWMGIPSLAFAFAHFDPISAGGNVWLILAITFVFGLIAADLTRRTGNIGAAWGIHFVNNCYAILIWAYSGPLDGLALFSGPMTVADPAFVYVVPFNLAYLGLVWWLVTRRVASRAPLA
ncbi:MAG: lysostaphin resistance A-like protein, partial [Shimia sp.]